MMKTNPVKRKLRAGEPTFGTWLSLGNLQATRTLARCGFDWLTVDLEHQPIDLGEAAALLACIADAGCVPLARVPSGSHESIKRVLDAGAWGIVVPMVNTVQQAQVAIAAAKYPPEGNRSLGGGMHALNFDTSTDEYYRRANDEILVILQTESPQGVANASEIYQLPGIDAIFVGPVDLRANMRSDDGTEAPDEEFERMIARVIAAGMEAGTPTGIHALDVENALARAAQGMQFVAVGSDLWMMSRTAQEVLATLGPGGVRADVTRY